MEWTADTLKQFIDARGWKAAADVFNKQREVWQKQNALNYKSGLEHGKAIAMDADE